MAVTPSGMLMLVNPVDENASPPIYSMLSGSLMLFNFLQTEKTDSAIPVTLEGRLTEIKFSHPRKAWVPKYVMPSLTMMLCMESL